MLSTFYIAVMDGPYSPKYPGPYISEFPLSELQDMKSVLDNISSGQWEGVQSIIFVDLANGISKDVTREVALHIMDERLPDDDSEWTHWENDLWSWANKKLKANGVMKV